MADNSDTSKKNEELEIQEISGEDLLDEETIEDGEGDQEDEEVSDDELTDDNEDEYQSGKDEQDGPKTEKDDEELEGKVDGKGGKEETKEEKPEKELTEEEISKRDDKTFYIIIGAIIIALVIFFGVSYYMNTHPTPKQDTSNMVEYNNFKFYYYDDFWNFQWQRGSDLYDVALRYNPIEAEKVPVYVKKPFNNFTTEKVYLTFDPLGNNTPYMALAVGELGLSMKKVFGFTPEAACMQNKTESCFTRPIINCTNTNESVIVLQEKNETMVIVDGNCLIVQGSQKEMLRSIDRILYEWYGIIKPKMTKA